MAIIEGFGHELLQSEVEDVLEHAGDSIPENYEEAVTVKGIEGLDLVSRRRRRSMAMAGRVARSTTPYRHHNRDRTLIRV